MPTINIDQLFSESKEKQLAVEKALREKTAAAQAKAKAEQEEREREKEQRGIWIREKVTAATGVLRSIISAGEGNQLATSYLKSLWEGRPSHIERSFGLRPKDPAFQIVVIATSGERGMAANATEIVLYRKQGEEPLIRVQFYRHDSQTASSSRQNASYYDPDPTLDGVLEGLSSIGTFFQCLLGQLGSEIEPARSSYEG